MGKYTILLASTILILSAAVTTSADLANPDCENDQPSHLDRVSQNLRDTARSCEGMQWHGEAGYTGQNCELHQRTAAEASADAWCVAVAGSALFGGWNNGATMAPDVATSGNLQDGVKVHAGVGIMMVGRAMVGADGCVLAGQSCAGKLFMNNGVFLEDESDKSPAAPVCEAVLLQNPFTRGAADNCLAFAVQLTGLTNAVVGDDEETPEEQRCTHEEYERARAEGKPSSCKRDYTAISATVRVLP